MELSPAYTETPDPSNGLVQALLVKRAVRLNENEQLALIESARLTGPAQPLDSSLVGQLLNEKA